MPKKGGKENLLLTAYGSLLSIALKGRLANGRGRIAPVVLQTAVGLSGVDCTKMVPKTLVLSGKNRRRTVSLNALGRRFR